DMNYLVEDRANSFAFEIILEPRRSAANARAARIGDAAHILNESDAEVFRCFIPFAWEHLNDFWIPFFRHRRDVLVSPLSQFGSLGSIDCDLIFSAIGFDYFLLGRASGRSDDVDLALECISK